MLPAVLVFAVGLAIVVAPLTATAMGAAPAEHAGIASAVNNVVARAAGLLAVALLPAARRASPAPTRWSHDAGRRVPDRDAHLGRRCAAGGGVIAALTIRNPPRPPAAGRRSHSRHLALRRRQPAAVRPGAGGRGRAGCGAP